MGRTVGSLVKDGGDIKFDSSEQCLSIYLNLTLFQQPCAKVEWLGIWAQDNQTMFKILHMLLLLWNLKKDRLH